MIKGQLFTNSPELELLAGKDKGNLFEICQITLFF